VSEYGIFELSGIMDETFTVSSEFPLETSFFSFTEKEQVQVTNTVTDDDELPVKIKEEPKTMFVKKMPSRDVKKRNQRQKNLELIKTKKIIVIDLTKD
jgi:hypothetical protein